uniref:Ig-like domain-containing protein n=1 Tax=Mastacembelus armatus TaxID=205130 RepID=A0A3Q3LNU4_9TELE
KRVEAAVGLDVTLHCCLQTRQTPEVTFVQWTFNGSELVILYRSRAVSAEHIPAEQFKGRVSFSQRDKLNFSVTISAVQKTDQGIYSCKAGAKRRFTCETELLVGTGELHRHEKHLESPSKTGRRPNLGRRFHVVHHGPKGRNR